MFYANSSTLAVAGYLLANKQGDDYRYIENDAVAAATLTMKVHTYRRALLNLGTLGAISRLPLERGPVKIGDQRLRVCFINILHPFWSLVRAYDEMTAWRK